MLLDADLFLGYVNLLIGLACLYLAVRDYQSR
jgi:hypothetical protein